LRLSGELPAKSSGLQTEAVPGEEERAKVRDYRKNERHHFNRMSRDLWNWIQLWCDWRLSSDPERACYVPGSYKPHSHDKSFSFG